MNAASSQLAQQYVQLALAIEQHIPGYVDAYFGPPEWRRQAENAGSRPVAELAQAAQALVHAIEADMEMGAQRKDYLERQVRAMQTSLRILQGDVLALADEVEWLYDIRPEPVDERLFDDAHSVLKQLLPPGDTLAERMAARKQRTELPADRLLDLLNEITDHIRAQTQARFSLPAHESVTLQLVTEQPWRAYNWYLGDASSRIDINVDLPWHITDLASIVAHECYPGHHTELSTKEAALLHEWGWSEHSVALINTPACVVSEGIATVALSVLFAEDDLIDWYTQELYPRAGFGHLDAGEEYAISAARKKLTGVSGNAAFLLHDQGVDETEVARYIMRYSLATENEARKSVSFISDPLYRSYIFTYRYGAELLDALFDAKGDRDLWMKRLLIEPVTPSQIRSWL